jgi:hypothetical protein
MDKCGGRSLHGDYFGICRCRDLKQTTPTGCDHTIQISPWHVNHLLDDFGSAFEGDGSRGLADPIQFQIDLSAYTGAIIAKQSVSHRIEWGWYSSNR